MDLHSGTPFWPLRNGLLATYPPLEESLETPVAIIGAGITGALVAHHLAEAGVECIVLDRRDVASGSTAASTALLQYEIDVPLRRLIRLIGDVDAARAYCVCHGAIDKLEQLVRRLGVDVEFKRTRSLQGASRAAHLPGLRHEVELHQRLGFDVQLWDQPRLRRETDLPFHGALISQQAAQVDPHRLTFALLASAAAQGAKVFDRTAVVNTKRTRHGVELHTANGHRVRARHLIVATGYETTPWLPDDLVKLNSTYALITEPTAQFPGWPEESVVWETSRPYVYMRHVDKNRLIIGGYDEPFKTPSHRDALLKAKTATLTRRLHRMLPVAHPVAAWSWCATFAETADGLPFIGRRTPNDPVYFTLGYGGNGITYSQVAAEIIRDIVIEGSSRDEDLFRFDRSSALYK